MADRRDEIMPEVLVCAEERSAERGAIIPGVQAPGARLPFFPQELQISGVRAEIISHEARKKSLVSQDDEPENERCNDEERKPRSESVLRAAYYHDSRKIT